MTSGGSGIIVLLSIRVSATVYGIFLHKLISTKQDKYSTFAADVSESGFDNLTL
jgi:hypothetical protein